MSKRDSAPTVGWVIGSQVNKWLALAFVMSVLIWGVAIWTVRYSLNRDCTDLYERRISVFGYWVVVNAGSLDPECPQYGD